MRGQLLVFCQCHSSRTIYHARTDWLQYLISLVPSVPVYLQQKTNLALNDPLEPQIVLRFSACTRYAKWCRFCVVSYFCAVNRFDHGKPIESDNYKNQWDESNQNSNNFNIEHLPFEMVYYYSQRLPSNVIKGVCKITTPDNSIGTIWWFVSDLVGRVHSKTWHE